MKYFYLGPSLHKYLSLHLLHSLCNLVVFPFLPKGPSGGITPSVGPADRADSREGHAPSPGPEAPAVLAGMCRHLGVDWR